MRKGQRGLLADVSIPDAESNDSSSRHVRLQDEARSGATRIDSNRVLQPSFLSRLEMTRDDCFL
jgi:hypothetical protein